MTTTNTLRVNDASKGVLNQLPWKQVVVTWGHNHRPSLQLHTLPLPARWYIVHLHQRWVPSLDFPDSRTEILKETSLVYTSLSLRHSVIATEKIKMFLTVKGERCKGRHVEEGMFRGAAGPLLSPSTGCSSRDSQGGCQGSRHRCQCQSPALTSKGVRDSLY